jgi:hypothetical protein
MKTYLHVLSALIITCLLVFEPAEFRCFKALGDRTEHSSGTQREAPHDEFESRILLKICASAQRQVKQDKGSLRVRLAGNTSCREYSGLAFCEGQLFVKALLKTHLSTTVLRI